MKVHLTVCILIFSLTSLILADHKNSVTNSVQQLEDVTASIKMDTVLEEAFDYSYASFGKPDPFIPNMRPAHLPSVSVLITSILQRYTLDQIRLVGIWQLENGSKKSLLMTEKSEGVVVAVGDSVGIKGGKVKEIESDHVVIREFTLDSDGEKNFSDRTIWLGSREEKKSEKDKSLTIQFDSYPEEEVAKITEPASAEVKTEVKTEVKQESADKNSN